MFLPYKLLKRLDDLGLWKAYLDYQKQRRRVIHNLAGAEFIRRCLKNDLIPNFLKFRIPANGCFEQATVHIFQKRLLRKELSKAVTAQNEAQEPLERARNKLRDSVPQHLLISIVFNNRQFLRGETRGITLRHE